MKRLGHYARFAFAALTVFVAVFFVLVSCSRRTASNVQSDMGQDGKVLVEREAVIQTSNPIPQEAIDELDANLRLIADYPVPAGQTAESFDRMRLELARGLFENAISRSVSEPATGEGGTVKDLRFEDNKIKWTYANAGDYNEDGEVLVADIVALVAHFGAVVGDGVGDDALEAWVDGNGDGEVTPADISVIAQNFLSRVERYRLIRKTTLEGYPITVMYVPLNSALDTHPRTFEIAKSDIPESHQKYWPFLFAAVEPIDEKGKPGDKSEYVAMNTIVPELTRPGIVAGVTGRIGVASAKFSYNIITPEKPVETFEWDFGGGAVPNTATGSEIRLTFAAPGTYVGTLTATSQYGTFVEKFPVVSKELLRTGRELLWIDAYNLPYYGSQGTESDLELDIYALGFEKQSFDLAELFVYFDGVDRTPYSALEGLHGWGYHNLRFPRSGGDSQGYSPQMKHFQARLLLEDRVTGIHEGVSNTSSSLLSTMVIKRSTFPAMMPSSVLIRVYDSERYTNGDFTARIVCQDFDGWFDWKTYDPEFDAPLYRPGGMQRITPDVEYLAGVGVKISFKAGINADYNGDNIVDLMDINCIEARYLGIVGDGILDDYDFQCDGDENGEVGIPDITPINNNYLSSAPGFRLKRDGVTIAEYEVPCPRFREEGLFNLWPVIEYIDADATPGEHEYWVCAYDPLTGDEGDPSRSAIVTVE